jgi:hypothetical protein
LEFSSSVAGEHEDLGKKREEERKGYFGHFLSSVHAGRRTWSAASVKLAILLSFQFYDGKNIEAKLVMAVESSVIHKDGNKLNNLRRWSSPPSFATTASTWRPGQPREVGHENPGLPE